MLRYQLFPRSFGMIPEVKQVVEVFENHYEQIKSSTHELKSDEVLSVLRYDLEKIDFKVETNKTQEGKIKIPVLYSLNGQEDKFFYADAVSHNQKIIVEVEAGRGYVNNQFLKDIFQACMMPYAEYLVVAVRNDYKGNDDFYKIFLYLETLYINGRLKLPLQGIVLIGY
jgi:hypothetical protein